MISIKVKKSICCHSGETDCFVIDRTSHIAVLVIPGLTRNPALFEGIMTLDAGSSPA
jgi:hypothetical protein